MNPHSCTVFYLLTLFLSALSLRATDASLNPALCAQTQKNMQRSVAGAVACSSLAALLAGCALYARHVQKKSGARTQVQKKKLRRMVLLGCGGAGCASFIAALFLAARGGLLWRKIVEGKRQLMAGERPVYAWLAAQEKESRLVAEERAAGREGREKENQQNWDRRKNEKAHARTVADQEIAQLVTRCEKNDELLQQLVGSHAIVADAAEVALERVRQAEAETTRLRQAHSSRAATPASGRPYSPFKD